MNRRTVKRASECGVYEASDKAIKAFDEKIEIHQIAFDVLDELDDPRYYKGMIYLLTRIISLKNLKDKRRNRYTSPLREKI